MRCSRRVPRSNRYAAFCEVYAIRSVVAIGLKKKPTARTVSTLRACRELRLVIDPERRRGAARSATGAVTALNASRASAMYVSRCL